jgi:hypothetical protein
MGLPRFACIAQRHALQLSRPPVPRSKLWRRGAGSHSRRSRGAPWPRAIFRQPARGRPRGAAASSTWRLWLRESTSGFKRAIIAVCAVVFAVDLPHAADGRASSPTSCARPVGDPARVDLLSGGPPRGGGRGRGGLHGRGPWGARGHGDWACAEHRDGDVRLRSAATPDAVRHRGHVDNGYWAHGPPPCPDEDWTSRGGVTARGRLGPHLFPAWAGPTLPVNALREGALRGVGGLVGGNANHFEQRQWGRGA